MKGALKQAASFGGAALCVASLVFVFFRLGGHVHEIDLSAVRPAEWALIASAALAYGIASVLLGLAWGDVLGFLGCPAGRLLQLRLHGMTQLAKYIPGNVFHFAGRQAMGQAAGLPGWPLAKSIAWELGLFASTGAVFSVMLLPLPGLGNAGRFLLLALGLGVFCAVLGKIFGRPVVLAALKQAAFLAVSGTAFFCALQILSPDALGERFAAILGAFVIAWLVGLVVPGAPAGLGVREVVLYALLGAFQPSPVILAAVVLGRIVTVAGDVVYFLIGAGAGVLGRAERARA